MACNCTGTVNTCIRAYVNICSTGIDLGLEAPVSGDYLILVEGMLSAKKYVLTIAEGDNIIIPNTINNSYTYKLQIFQPDGDLLNDTCYTLRTMVTLGSDVPVIPTPPIVETRNCSIEVLIKADADTSLTYSLCNGQLIQLEYLPGETLTILDTNGVPYLPGLAIVKPYFLSYGIIQGNTITFDSVSGVFTKPDNGGFNDGDIFTIQYEQPI